MNLDTSPEALRALRRLAERATRGPWCVSTTQHPFRLVRYDGTVCAGEHTEHHIVTVRDHPQSKAPDPIVTISVGAGIDDGPPVHKVYIRPEDADYIAAVSPEVVLALLDALAAEKESATVKPDLTVGSPLVFRDFACTPQHAVECAYLLSLAEADTADDDGGDAMTIVSLYVSGDMSMDEAIAVLAPPGQMEASDNG